MRTAAEAQKTVLALALQHPEVYRRVSVETTPAHYDGPRRDLFSAMQQIGEPLEPSLLVDALSSSDKERQKLAARISALKFLPADKTALPRLLGELQDAYQHRNLNNALQRALAEVQRSEAQMNVLAAKIERDILEATRSSGSQGQVITATEALAQAYIEAQKAADMGGFSGFTTGLSELDGLLGGFPLGGVTTIMGEAGVGKTALMLQTALHVSKKTPVAIVSLEMNGAGLMHRMQSALSGVSYRSVQGGRMSEGEQQMVYELDGPLSTAPLFIAPPHVQSFDDALAFFRYAYFEHGCRACYLDNILSLDYGARTEYEHVTHVANGSQRLANELQIALMNLHHTNTSERPTLRNVHGAKAIARHSTNVLALYQPDPTYNQVEFIELKGRKTGKGDCRMVFEGVYQRFRSLGVRYVP